MKYLNLGCGSHYSTLPEWTNLDFISTGNGVIVHNLLKGIPFENDGFDLVYHSHVLEHFSKEDGVKFINECFRVLKPGGVVRIAVPDLEKIVRNYLKYMEAGLNEPGNKIIRHNYEWMLLEMYDQTTRNFSGGNMAKYIYQDNLVNENFIYERLGDEARTIRNNYLSYKSEKDNRIKFSHSKTKSKGFVEHLKFIIKSYLLKRWNVDETSLAIGKFRLGGEIHQWMYDRYSLANLLKEAGGNNIQIQNAFTSFVNNWSEYNIDGKEGIPRKPDSLFMEAIK